MQALSTTTRIKEILLYVKRHREVLKWEVLLHFSSIYGWKMIPQPTTERYLRTLCRTGYIAHPDFMGQPEKNKYVFVKDME